LPVAFCLCFGGLQPLLVEWSESFGIFLLIALAIAEFAFLAFIAMILDGPVEAEITAKGRESEVGCFFIQD